MTKRSARLDAADLVHQRAGFGEAPQPPLRDDAAATILDGERVRAILDTARSAGMLDDKTARISGRVSPTLVAQAKQRTGISSDSDLITFALASVALDDDFAAVFRLVQGTVDPDIKLGF